MFASNAVRKQRRRKLPTAYVSNFGRIQNRKGHRYFPKPDASGYCWFNTMRVHRLVHVLFSDPNLEQRLPGQSVDHKDRDRVNNRSDNLRWSTAEQQSFNRNRSNKLHPWLGSMNKKLKNEQLENETWKKLAAGGEVSDLGRYKPSHRNVRYFPAATPSGYVRVGNGGSVDLLHHLVLESFGFLRPSTSHCVDHIDRNRSNNRLSNLRWVLPVEQHANKSHTPTSQIRRIEWRPVGALIWQLAASAKDAAIATGVAHISEVTGVANPKSAPVTAPGTAGRRFEFRYPPQDAVTIEGEVWKPIVVSEWVVGGRYYGLE